MSGAPNDALVARILHVIQRTADRQGNTTMIRLAENIAAEVSADLSEAMAEAWERGNNDGLTFAAAPQKSLLTNPYRASIPDVGGAEGYES